MNSKEALKAINETIDTIKSHCCHVDDEGNADHVAYEIESWLDQLKKEINDYKETLDKEEK